MKEIIAHVETPFIDSDYLLEKFEAKGGWTYARIPEIGQDKTVPFGWVRVRGSIDGYPIRAYNLMPMGNGRLFLPVKASIRKVIKKEAGDYVRIILFPDDAPIEIPEELKLCLMDEPHAYETFLSYSDGEKKGFIDWIYSAKRIETRVNRITETLNKLAKGEKFYSYPNKE